MASDGDSPKGGEKKIPDARDKTILGIGPRDETLPGVPVAPEKSESPARPPQESPRASSKVAVATREDKDEEKRVAAAEPAAAARTEGRGSVVPWILMLATVGGVAYLERERLAGLMGGWVPGAPAVTATPAVDSSLPTTALAASASASAPTPGSSSSTIVPVTASASATPSAAVDAAAALSKHTSADAGATKDVGHVNPHTTTSATSATPTKHTPPAPSSKATEDRSN
jgi:hypothetical protein